MPTFVDDFGDYNVRHSPLMKRGIILMIININLENKKIRRKK